MIRDALVELTGLPSRWNGMVVTVDGVDYAGQLGYDNVMRIARMLYSAHLANWWRTLIHESIHGVSVGPHTPSAYAAHQGYEEGLAEGLQRLWRQRILKMAGRRVPERAFASVDATHPFATRFLKQLQRDCDELRMSPETLYPLLIRTPLTERAGTMARLRSSQYLRRKAGGG